MRVAGISKGDCLKTFCLLYYQQLLCVDYIRMIEMSNENEIWWWWCAVLQTTLGIELPDVVPWLTINNVLTDCSAWALSIKELLWNRRVSLIVDFIFLLGQCFSPSINFLFISASHQISPLIFSWDKKHTGPPKMKQNTWKTNKMEMKQPRLVIAKSYFTNPACSLWFS